MPNLYVLGGVALLVMSLLAGLLYYRGNAIDAVAVQKHIEAQLDIALTVNRHNEETIGRLRASNAITDRLTAENAKVLGFILQKVTDTNTDIAELGKTNEDVRNYLAGAIPGSLQRVLNKPRRRRRAKVRAGADPRAVPGADRAGLQARGDHRRARRSADSDTRLQGRLCGAVGRHKAVANRTA